MVCHILFFSKLYDNLIATAIEYAAALWGMREYSCICSRACRFVMGCSKFTPNTDVRGDMGWKGLKHRQQLCVVRVRLRLRLRLRLINMGKHRVIKKVFNEQYAAANN